MRTNHLFVSMIVSAGFALLAAHAAAAPFTGDLVILSETPGSVSYRLTEYTLGGTLLQTIIPPQAPGSTDLWNPRDIVFGGGLLHLFNGTFDPYLSSYNPAADAWSHRTHAGWSTINNVSYGGIAYSGDRVFVTDMATSGKPSQGVIAFNMTAGTSSEFATNLSPIDLNMGLDGKLWVLSGTSAFAFDPVTFAALGSVSVSAVGDPRAIAADANGELYVASWNGPLVHLSSSGSVLATLPSFAGSLIDVDLSPTGKIALGTRLNGSYITDTSFSTPVQIESNRWNSFVTFVPVPEPGAISLVAIAVLIAARRRAR